MRIVVEQNVDVPMRDGTVLRADVYRPYAPGRFPLLVRRTPYGRGGPPAGASLDALRLVNAGYVLLVQDVRGRGGSQGGFEPFRYEGQDGADTVAWAAAQPYCDGAVGMLGRSYEGTAALLAAADAPDALGAVTPHMAGSGLHEGWCYQGGAFQLGFCLHWTLIDLVLPQLPPPGVDGAHPDTARVVAALDGIEELYRTPWRAPALLDRLAPYYREWLEHPVPGKYWQRAAPNEGYEAMRAPGLHIGGWYDIFLGGTLENFTGMRTRAGSAAARELSTLVVGPWSHRVAGGIFPQRRYGTRADEQVLDVTALHVAHFDRALKGTASGAHERVRLFLTGADRWVAYEDWPVPGTRTVALHLTSGARHANTAAGDGRLLAGPPVDAAADRFRHDPADPVPTTGGPTLMTGLFVGSDCGPQDQRAVEARPDVLCYTGDVLTAPLTVVGEVVLVAYASTSGHDTDLTAKLVDVAPDGRAENLCDGIVRARYHAAPDDPRPLTPGRTVELTVRLGAVGHVFRTGHRIRLEVAGSNFPRFDVNPGTGGCSTALRDQPYEPQVVSVHHGSACPSRLLLPVLADS
ncbi:CocE/NonD family hydrolase [Streptomyces silaceus]|uniref:CocE/NonD family hydrolase n=1 Tax=Streptomyces silaceus TaxID=545123 RepID=UPI000A9A1C4D|nr:CocE/NonD family hydrolase [Streptomyces silaceus]